MISENKPLCFFIIKKYLYTFLNVRNEKNILVNNHKTVKTVKVQIFHIDFYSSKVQRTKIDILIGLYIEKLLV